MLLSSRDPELVRRIGEATALEVRATGIPYVFAPCIAVIIEKTSFVVYTHSLESNFVFLLCLGTNIFT